MFDVKSIPKIVIREGILNDTQIVKNDFTYRLLVNDLQWMAAQTNSTIELRELYSSYDLSEGNVLLTGFGFGILPQWIAQKPEVTSLTVVEINEDVVNLFLRFNKLNPKIKIVISDITQYKDDIDYDWVILDHYEEDRMPTKDKLTQITNNLKCSNLWFWPLELLLTKYSSWEQFRKDYSMKIPDLPKNQILDYMETIFKHREFPL